MKYEKMLKTFVALCALVLVFALPAHAQTQGSGAQGRGSEVTGLSLDKGLLGKDVLMRSGEKIGEIDDVIFNRRGVIAHYLVNVGGFQGAGEKTVALSPNQIQVNGQDRIMFNGNRAELENMPAANADAWGNYHDGNSGERNGYGSDPYGGGTYPPRPYYGRNYMSNPSDGQTGQDQQSQRFQQGGGQPNPLGQAWGEQPINPWVQGWGNQQRQTRGAMSGLSGNTLMGAKVLNSENNQIGTIDDFVVETQKGRITHVGIGVGGFLGIGENHVLVPFNQVRFLDQDTALYRGDQNRLGQLPQYQVADNGEVAMQNQRAGGSPQGAQRQRNQQQSGGSQGQWKQGTYPRR